jgi:hypothetical protein
MTAVAHLHPSTHQPARPGALTVTAPQSSKRTDLTSRIVASLILGLPSAAAIYGSAAALVKIAGDRHLSDPRVLPFCLDVLAIGIVVSAVFCGHDDRLSRWTPWLAYGASAGLQVADVWTDGPTAWAVHALPLAAAILGTEKILRLWRPVAPVATVLEVDEPAEAATPEPAAEVVALASVPKVSRPVPARKAPARQTKPAPVVEVDPDVLERVRKALAEMGVDASETSRDAVLAHIRETDGKAPHVSKVGPAFRQLKEES